MGKNLKLTKESATPWKQKQPRVSVVIPTHNRSDLLQVTIKSVLAQTYRNIEIIVVDDGSTDDTPQIMAPYPQVTYLKTVHQGVDLAIKTGVEMASGDYINILDDDDLMMPTKLERQVQILNARPEVGLVHCRYYHMDKDGKLLEKVWLLPEENSFEELLYGCFIWSGAPLIRRRCFEQPGLFDAAIWYGHVARLLRIALAGYQFACIQEPLGAYRILPDSRLARRGSEGSATDIFEALDMVFADPRLPAHIAAVKARSYALTHFWFSHLYYANGRWDIAQQSLAEALRLYPALLETGEFSQRLYAYALSPRNTDPVGLVADMFDHLPPGAESLRQHRSKTLSRVYIGVALRHYGLGNIAEGKAHLNEALALEPEILEQPDEFATTLGYNALVLCVDSPLRYIDTVLQNLPAEAQPLAKIRSQVLSHVSISCAFEDFFAGYRRTSVLHHVFTGLRYQPSWIKNRGVVSIFVKSLLGLIAGLPGHQLVKTGNTVC